VAIVTKTKQTTKGIIKMKKVLSLMLAGIALLANESHSVTFFADDFEARGAAGATGLSSPWEMNKQVFAAPNVANADGVLGGIVGGFYPGTTFGPNAIVAGGAGGSAFGAKLWPDYGYSPDWGNNQRVAVSLLVTKVGLTAQDISPGVIQFDFDYLRDASVGPRAQAYGFVKLLSPTWETWATNVFDLAASGDWLHGSARMTFGDLGAVGANLQWGVVVSDANYGGGAGVQIDNVTVSNVPEPTAASLLGLGLAGLLATRLRRRS
jgi:hypothetical protein